MFRIGQLIVFDNYIYGDKDTVYIIHFVSDSTNAITFRKYGSTTYIHLTEYEINKYKPIGLETGGKIWYK